MRYWYYSVHVFDDDISVNDFVSDTEYYEYLEENQSRDEDTDS